MNGSGSLEEHNKVDWKTSHDEYNKKYDEMTGRDKLRDDWAAKNKEDWAAKSKGD